MRNVIKQIHILNTLLCAGAAVYSAVLGDQLFLISFIIQANSSLLGIYTTSLTNHDE